MDYGGLCINKGQESSFGLLKSKILKAAKRIERLLSYAEKAQWGVLWAIYPMRRRDNKLRIG